MKSSVKTSKHEEMGLWEHKTVEDVIKRIPYLIQEVYNKKQFHSALGYVPPDEFENNLFHNQKQLYSHQLITI